MRLEQALRDLAHDAYPRRMAAVAALEDLAAPETAAALRGALRDPVAGVRSRAASALSRLGRSEETARALARLLGDPAPFVRAATARALIRVAPEPGAFLAAAAADDAPEVRRAAAEAGDRLPGELLARLLADADWRVRRAAVEATGGERAATVAHAALDDSSWHVRRSAARRIEELGAREVAGVLARALADPHDLVRAAAFHALQVVLPRAELVALLARELRSPDPVLRRVLLYRLAELGPGDAGGLAAVAADPDRGVRMALAGVAARLPGERGGELLERLARDPDPGVRLAAERALTSR